MAVLSDADRADVNGEFMRTKDGPISITKADCRAAVNALDDWLNTNAATINNALPAAAKAALNQEQKARLLKYVITQRYISNA